MTTLKFHFRSPFFEDERSGILLMTKTFLAYWDKIINSLVHEISKVGDGFVCNSPGINPGKE